MSDQPKPKVVLIRLLYVTDAEANLFRAWATPEGGPMNFPADDPPPMSIPLGSANLTVVMDSVKAREAFLAFAQEAFLQATDGPGSGPRPVFPARKG